jgi:predicted nucleotidyltransferase
VKQPLISAIESGKREATVPVALALADALQLRPSVALARLRSDVLDIMHANRGRAVHIFGSVARGEDAPGSDLDLMVEFDEGADIADLLAMEEELSELLTVPVDVISSGSSSRVTARARSEMVPL